MKKSEPMKRFDRREYERSYREKRRIRARHIIDVSDNPWEYFDVPKGTILICNDLMTQVMPRKILPEVENKYRALQGYRESDVCIKPIFMRDPTGKRTALRGGYVDLWQKNRRIRIYDTKGFAQGYTTAAEFADIVAELYRVGQVVDLNLLPRLKDYTSLTNIIPNLISPEQVRAIPKLKPRQAKIRAPGPYIGSDAFGRDPSTIFYYDIRKAYIYGLAFILPDLAQKLAKAENLCKGRAKVVIKVLRAAIVGIMNSKDSPYYRPDLARFCYGVTRAELVSAMHAVENNNGTVYRWHTDGFLADTDVSHLINVGDDIGQWRVEAYKGLTLLATNTWWAGTPGNRKTCDGLIIKLGITEREVLEHFENFGDKSLEITCPDRFSWKTATWKAQTREINFCHSVKCMQDPHSPAEAMHLRSRPEEELWSI